MTTHYTVQQGDCIDSIAFRHGFFPATLWDHADNKALKDLRKDGNILQPGDDVVIPELRRREESCATEARHKFKRRGVPAELHMVFSRRAPPEDEAAEPAGKPYSSTDYDDPEPEESEVAFEPLANAPYLIEIDGTTKEGTSDGDGAVKVPIIPDARSGKITFHRGTKDEISFDIALGNLDAVDSIPGQRARLCNLGYTCAPDGDAPDDSLRDALRRFQEDNSLEKSGEADQATKDKLVELHGS